MNEKGNAFLEVMGAILGILFIFFFILYPFFWLLPHDVVTQKTCLEAGYPEHDIDMFGNGYCINVDGAVTGKVKTVEEVKQNNQ